MEGVPGTSSSNILPNVTKKINRCETWGYDETKCLVNLWSAARVQQELRAVSRNRPVWESVTKDFNHQFKPTVPRTWLQCKTRIQNLLNKYKAAKDENRKSGAGRSTCLFFEEIDIIMGTRAVVEPPVLLDSIQNENLPTVNNEVAIENEHDISVLLEESVDTSLDESTESHVSEPLPSNTKKRKCTATLATMMDNFLSELKNSEERFYEAERKRWQEERQWEEELRRADLERERRYEERMFELLKTIVENKK